MKIADEGKMKRGVGGMSENGICFNLEFDFLVGLAQEPVLD